MIPLVAAYNTISYLNSTPLAARFTRFTPEEFAELEDPHKITMNILDGKKKKRKATTSDSKAPKKQKVETSKDKKEPKAKKGKSKMIVDESEEEEEDAEVEDIEAMIREAEEYEEDEEEVEVDDDGWQVFKANDSENRGNNLKLEKGNKSAKKGEGKFVEVLDLVDDSD